jgi:hypothetical protein
MRLLFLNKIVKDPPEIADIKIRENRFDNSFYGLNEGRETFILPADIA